MTEDPASDSSAATELPTETPPDSGVVRARPRLHPVMLVAILLAGLVAMAFLAYRAFVPGDCGCSGRTHKVVAEGAPPLKALPGRTTSPTNTGRGLVHSVAGSTATDKSARSKAGIGKTHQERSKPRTTEEFVHE